MILTTNLASPPRPENAPSWKQLNPRRSTDDGRDLPDPTPIAPPIGYVQQPHLWEQIRNMVRSEQLAYAAREAGAETFEEAEDMGIGDDDDAMPDSPWEDEFEGSTLAELKSLQEFAAKEIKRRAIKDSMEPVNPAPEGGIAPTSPPSALPGPMIAQPDPPANPQG